MGSQNKAKRKAMEKAFKRQKGRCALCNEPMNQSKDPQNKMRATADHIVPKSKGGAIAGNIQAVHSVCNSKRGNMHIQNFTENLRKEKTNDQ